LEILVCYRAGFLRLNSFNSEALTTLNLYLRRCQEFRVKGPDFLYACTALMSRLASHKEVLKTGPEKNLNPSPKRLRKIVCPPTLSKTEN
jgi:hypothetical protein